ncbi:MAG: hypothetical protein HC906_11225 [Bacteroidales bacterium]|nr:hypothetical protein [Bacteroidales bacterium]
MNIQYIQNRVNTLQTITNEKNGSYLLQFYSQSKIQLSEYITANAGIHSQYFKLSGRQTFEPRVAIKWKFLPEHSFSLAYGLHAQAEMIQLHLVEKNTPDGLTTPNKNLDFNKSHHLVAGYGFQINENLHFKIETYYQKLINIPVIPDSTVSGINLNAVWGFNEILVSEGSGKNYGIDLTLERYLEKGYYYLFTASLFDSKYTGGDRIERNTKYNRNYVFNILGGKEWATGHLKKNLFNVNIRFSYLGGDRIIPLDVPLTYENKEIVEDPYRSYDQKLKDAPILSFQLDTA